MLKKILFPIIMKKIRLGSKWFSNKYLSIRTNSLKMYYVITHEFNGYKYLSFQTSECF